MELEEKAEEIMETLWIHSEEMEQPSIPLNELAMTEQKPIEQLLEAGYVSLTDGRVKLTENGRPFARNVVRRHRLA